MTARQGMSRKGVGGGRRYSSHRLTVWARRAVHATDAADLFVDAG
ncbi:hypothetical protein ABZ930_11820 [Streptomyces sp. NPDC046716]